MNSADELKTTLAAAMSSLSPRSSLFPKEPAPSSEAKQDSPLEDSPETNPPLTPAAVTEARGNSCRGNRGVVLEAVRQATPSGA